MKKCAKKISITATLIVVFIGASVFTVLVYFNTLFANHQILNMHFTGKQLTFDAKGHTINHTQVFSHDDQWLVYDTRNDDTHIGQTGSIEMVNTATGEVKELYHTTNQTAYGPGVGAATFSPVSDKVMFIQGIRNSDKNNPYGVTRRTGVSIDIKKPNEPVFMDARNVLPPFTVGALRGGTHSHSWSNDGGWISFTYNDYILEQLGKTDSTVQDLRTVGVMAPFGKVIVPDTSSVENNNGQLFSVLVTKVTGHPAWGSDDIEKAFDECWIGTKGYRKNDGQWQNRAIAFQGNVRDDKGNVKTEIYVADLPDDITREDPAEPFRGTIRTRPGVPSGVHQRRITHTESGVRGPRHWLRTTPDGSLIAFLAEDHRKIIQVFGVSPNGGAIKQLTFNSFPVQAPFSISPDGHYLAYIADNSVFVADLETTESKRLTPRYTDEDRPVDAVVWSNDGKSLAYNRYIKKAEGRFLQIFLLSR